MKRNLLFLSSLCLSFFTLIGCGPKPNSIPTYDYKVKSGPDKDIYLSGQNFNSKGIVFERTRSDMDCDCIDLLKLEDIEGAEIVDGNNLQAGQNEVTVKIDGKSFYFDIEVKETYTITCCGDSLTEGHMWANEAYPVFINDYANHTFNVVNCGRNGISITGYGGSWDNPDARYQLSEYYTKSINANPDVVLLFLGTNDGTNWEKAAPLFENQYIELIDSYLEALGPKTKFIMAVDPPTKSNTFGISNENIRDYINPIQRQLAEDYGMEMIDFRKLFEEREGGYDDFLRDGVHFSKAGAQFVAEQIANVLENI